MHPLTHKLFDSGHTLSHFADFQSVVGRQTHHLPPHTGGGGGEAVGGSTNNNIINSSSTNGSGSTSSHLALRPVKSRHSERCWGLLLTWQGQPVLGWTVSCWRSDRCCCVIELLVVGVLCEGV